MKIAAYTPDLTAQEAERFWLTPEQLCDLAALGGHKDTKVKRLLNTISDREHLPFVKSGAARTAPRLYSLASAAMLRVFWEITRDGRTYKYAEPVAVAVRKLLVEAVEKIGTVEDFGREYGEARVIFSGITDEGRPKFIKWARTADEISGKISLCYSVLDGGYIIFKLLNEYADCWHADLARGGKYG